MEQKSENIEPPVTVEARDLERVKGVEELELAKDVENLRFKISELELKLEEVRYPCICGFC